MIPAFLDTCVLLKPYLCDTLLTIAEDGAYRPLWPADVLTELRRNPIKRGASDGQAAHRIDQMSRCFPDAEVTGYTSLIPAMTNDPKDRHVLAAAVRGGAEILVTENLRDFPEQSTELYDIEIVHQDVFLLGQLDLSPPVVFDALHRQLSRYRREPRTLEGLLTVLAHPGHGCPRFAESCTQRR